MCAERLNREFGSGCRETPDIYNKFLEQLGYYRKHAATDSTSLFRVVSELQYDVQLYHWKVRLECVRFMRNNRGIFAKDVKYSYDSYVNNLTRTRTYGNLLELKALGLRYKANIFLFEPLTHGKWYIYNSKYKTTWRIYFGRDNHFDAVYPLEYMKVAAECQSIVYQLLYKDVLGLPDVEYAVERMLHDPDDKYIQYEKDADGTTIAITPDGLQMQLSKPGNTQCALMYSHLCHFHNQDNFDSIHEFFCLYGSDAGCRVYIGEYCQDRTSKPNPLLTDANSSCVRQLLALGITPFPYKAAKSLDPCIYRNVEYDVWREVRLAKINELLEAEKRFQNEKTSKWGEHLNQHPMMRKAPREQGLPQIASTSTAPAYIEGNGSLYELEPVKYVDVYGRIDTPVTNTPTYQVQQFYIPAPDPYAGNAFGILSAEPNHLTFGENGSHPIGVQGCIYNPYPATTPSLHYQATAQPPLKHLQSTPTLQCNDPLVVADHFAVLPPTLNQPMANEYVMMIDPTLSAQHQQLQYLQPVPPQQPQQQPQQQPYNLQELQLYQQHQRPRHQRRRQQHQPQQQTQQVASPFQQKWLFQCVPNTGDVNNRTPQSLTYDSNSYTTNLTAPGRSVLHPI